MSMYQADFRDEKFRAQSCMPHFKAMPPLRNTPSSPNTRTRVLVLVCFSFSGKLL